MKHVFFLTIIFLDPRVSPSLAVKTWSVRSRLWSKGRFAPSFRLVVNKNVKVCQRMVSLIRVTPALPFIFFSCPSVRSSR